MGGEGQVAGGEWGNGWLRWGAGVMKGCHGRLVPFRCTGMGAVR